MKKRSKVRLSVLVLTGAMVISGVVHGAEPAKAPADAKGKADAAAIYTQEIINAMDTDKNHEVSKAEFLDFMSKEFDRLDVNHDGKLQQTEILDKPVLGQQKTSVSHR